MSLQSKAVVYLIIWVDIDTLAYFKLQRNKTMAKNEIYKRNGTSCAVLFFNLPRETSELMTSR